MNTRANTHTAIDVAGGGAGDGAGAAAGTGTEAGLPDMTNITGQDKEFHGILQTLTSTGKLNSRRCTSHRTWRW